MELISRLTGQLGEGTTNVNVAIVNQQVAEAKELRDLPPLEHR